MKRFIVRVWLVIFSIGWLVPFTLSQLWEYDFVLHWVWPVAAWNDPSALGPVHLFFFSRQFLLVGVIWLAVVIVYWVWRVTEEPAT